MGLLVLPGHVVDQVVSKFTPDELMNLMARVFMDLHASYEAQETASNDVIIPHRSTVSSHNHHALFMPSRLAPLAGTAIKIVSVPTPQASALVKANGLPASTVVLDEQTGEVAAVVNARKLTPLRNAASSLLASSILVASLPQSVVAVGAGGQIAAHLALFLSQYPSIKSCKVFNRSVNARLDSLVGALRTEHAGVDISGHALVDDAGADDPALPDAVAGADIIITATSSRQALFPSSYVSPGTFLCLIGSYTPAMHEVDTALIRRAGKVVVDYKAGAAIEAGELIDAEFAPADVVELGELLAAASSESAPAWTANHHVVEDVRSAGDVTIFKSVGVGVQDVAIAQAVVQKAQRIGLGTVIEDYY
ncbi:hypothetical protein PHLGIDRAFT_228274 [Phlebiopsis gigantea 11061_1 CR5-6]|uniref:NAD(P)-binding protein n=1 Tax=Phlebiopsis gigantea (strain 11061_1 CR5-6) TaxID=745531 RepID=A0A0C3S286_PHLG1|nr:hypothetical protein PHLGIDRAFT_228274 [Phlebiopsis gigantea 11061_1 CR5-6]